jgi:3-oxoacyl-[acyl-carrier protein] reductase
MAADLDRLAEKPACYADLREQVVLITGGGSGIGRGIAVRLAAEGMRVAICGRRTEQLAETLSLLQAPAGAALAHPCDLARPEQVSELLEVVVSTLGPIDACVHCAMNMKFVDLADMTQAVWDETFATACRAGYLLAQSVAPSMKARGRGAILFISSVGAQRSHLPGLPYDAAKAAQEAMTRALAIELGPFGIRVNTLSPGRIGVRVREGTRVDLATPHVPLRRSGTAAEVAAATAFFLSQQSSYLTGQVLAVDGGLLAQLSLPGIWI